MKLNIRNLLVLAMPALLLTGLQASALDSPHCKEGQELVCVPHTCQNYTCGLDPRPQTQCFCADKPIGSEETVPRNARLHEH